MAAAAVEGSREHFALAAFRRKASGPPAGYHVVGSAKQKRDEWQWDSDPLTLRRSWQLGHHGCATRPS